MIPPVWTRDEVESPCVNICVVHPIEKLCAGCLRSLDEIGSWSRYTPEERRAIMDDLPNRASRLKKRRGGRAARLKRAE